MDHRLFYNDIDSIVSILNCLGRLKIIINGYINEIDDSRKRIASEFARVDQFANADLFGIAKVDQTYVNRMNAIVTDRLAKIVQCNGYYKRLKEYYFTIDGTT